MLDTRWTWLACTYLFACIGTPCSLPSATNLGVYLLY